MSKWTWKTWIMAGVIAAVFVAAGVLVAVGVATHEEPGLIEGVPQWDRDDFPLDWSVGRYTAEGTREAVGADRDAAEEAVSRVNARLGFAVLVPVREGHHSRVNIDLGVPSEPGWMDPGGDSRLRNETMVGRPRLVCDVRTSNTGGAADLTVLVLYHEIGHCLGLAHDDYELSIMRPTQRPTPDRVIPPWFSDSDRALLRGLYAPR